ncbi:hypothetical protein Ddc_03830 [Ditylenchus destructor]|nr:hypothetical protein Ddc_03830 [Ditylenchus destructor]
MKTTSNSGTRRQPTSPPQNHYRIGFGDLNMDSLWDAENEKYKVLCRMIHVTKATLHIGYIQMMISFIFLVFFTYHYMMAVTGHLSADHWMNQYTARYISQLLLAVSLQLILVVVMIHGVRSERRSLLLPYIIYASIAILAGCSQLAVDFMNMDNHSSGQPSGSEHPSRMYGNSQFVSHLIGTMIHAWCLSVVWRCYGYLGEKKVARQIGEQLSATQAAFQYPAEAQLLGYGLPFAQPPPYADTVLPPSYTGQSASPPIVSPLRRASQEPTAANTVVIEASEDPLLENPEEHNNKKINDNVV